MIKSVKTKEVELLISYNDAVTDILVTGNGDFKHHLIEETIFALADMFDMNDHLGVVWRRIKVKDDLSKEIDQENTLKFVIDITCQEGPFTVSEIKEMVEDYFSKEQKAGRAYRLMYNVYELEDQNISLLAGFRIVTMRLL